MGTFEATTSTWSSSTISDTMPQSALSAVMTRLVRMMTLRAQAAPMVRGASSIPPSGTGRCRRTQAGFGGRSADDDVAVQVQNSSRFLRPPGGDDHGDVGLVDVARTKVCVVGKARR